MLYLENKGSSLVLKYKRPAHLGLGSSCSDRVLEVQVTATTRAQNQVSHGISQQHIIYNQI